LSFSKTTRFIASRSGNSYGVYDVEHADRFQFNIDKKTNLAHPPEWMDGNRLIYSVNNTINVIQFDGTNQQKLTTADSAKDVLFDRDYTEFFSFNKSKVDKKLQAIYSTQIRLDGDK